MQVLTMSYHPQAGTRLPTHDISMSKRKDRIQSRTLFASVMARAASPASEGDADEGENEGAASHDSGPIDNDVLAASRDFAALAAASASGGRRPLTKMKKFRFQLLREWLVSNAAPCRVADIGGGKGLLSYLLNRNGFQATTIDPVSQSLPTKYKDLDADRQIRIAETESVPRRNAPFAPEMAADFDLLIAMHAHGCNVQIIDAAKEYGRDFLLLPCCIIDEPLRPAPGVHWLQCLADYARSQGFALEPFRLNFKGQNIGLYARHPENLRPLRYEGVVNATPAP